MESHDGSVPLLLDISDWLDLPLIWIYMAALRGVTSGVTRAMLPRALSKLLCTVYLNYTYYIIILKDAYGC